MKKTNKGFTLVELIIVIAVIGVLAAILIPVFANVIDKANQKSAASDARNAVSVFVAEMSDGTGGVVVTDGTVIAVDKAGKTYAFTFEDNGLKTEYDDCVITDGEGTETASGSAYTKDDIDKLPENVRIYLA